RGVAVVAADLLRGTAAGPVARAAGLADDVRTTDAAYARLGFEPVTHHAGDALARCRQRIAEAEQALALAARATRSGAVTSPRGRVESPRGQLTLGSAPSGFLVSLLAGLLAGMEWGQAVTAVASLDIDLEEAAAEQPLAAPA
ncbi:MAG: hypothetical protein M3N52_09695, partial [Actinomycetota bacterium]|nr:hypothetical protein [Actinomycetota bacterium]